MRQHVAACPAAVAQDAVVKQVIGRAIVDVQQRLVALLCVLLR